MSRPAHVQISDLDGLARLAVDGVTGVTDLVEHLHGTISRGAMLRSPDTEHRTGGITGLVYRSVRGVTGLVGGALELSLGTAARFGSAESSAPISTQRIRTIAILNGVLGDTLENRGNPLALPMRLLHEGRELQPEIAAQMLGPGAKVALLIHGLCLDEACWDAVPEQTGSADLPQQLARQGWTVLRLRYNSGRPIHANGRDLSALLQNLAGRDSAAVDRLSILGHSMGGLVARSAAHQGLEAGHDWTRRLDQLLCIATPHHGSPLERIGHGIDRALGISRYSLPFARLGKIRSAGITDLRHGRILDLPNDGRPIPTLLPPQTRCYSMAACLDADPYSMKSRHFGDGLVPVPAALGVHRDPARVLPAAQRHVITETGHLAILQSAAAAQCIETWLRD
jgi:pimeloyl-ACP methyl ester carboxylesterase